MKNEINNIDINTIDFEDNPVFSHPEDHYFDKEDSYIDAQESYTIANIRAENARNSSTTVNSSAGDSSFWNLKRVAIAIIVIFGLGTLSRIIVFLLALLCAIF